MGWAEPSTGIAPTIANSCSRAHVFLFAHTLGRIASIDAAIARHRRAERRVWPLSLWKAILDTRVLIAEDLGAARAPLVLAQVQC